MTTPTPGPELFPVLTPPPGGLTQLRQRLDGGPRRRRLLAPWRVAVGAAAVALVVVIVARVGSAGGVGAGVEVFGVDVGVSGPRVEVGGQALAMQPLSSSTLLVWLPPAS